MGTLELFTVPGHHRTVKLGHIPENRSIQGMALIIIIIIIIIIIKFINCSWVVTRWQWLFYMYTKYEIGY